MTNSQEKMLEYIQQVEDHYTHEDKFSFSGSGCVYFGPNGERCAFALVCPKEFYPLLERYNTETSASEIINLSDELHDEICVSNGISPSFFDELQECHDESDFLPEVLLEKLNNLRISVKEGLFDEEVA